MREYKALRDKDLVHDVFEAEQDGELNFTSGGTHASWSSPELLLKEFRKGEISAVRKMRGIRLHNERRLLAAEFKRKAEEGDVFSIINFYFSAATSSNQADSLWAHNMLANHPSKTAEFYLNHSFLSGRRDFYSKEHTLALALMAKENLRNPDWPEDRTKEIDEGHKRTLSDLRKRANAGEPDASWIIEQLDSTPVWSPNLDT